MHWDVVEAIPQRDYRLFCDLNHRLAAAANGWFKHRMDGHQAEGNER